MTTYIDIPTDKYLNLMDYDLKNYPCNTWTEEEIKKFNQGKLFTFLEIY